MKYTTKSPEETESLGEEFAKTLKPQDVIFLIGNLGSGKTTFTKGIARGLGITNRVLSPTFTIVRSYEIKNKESTIKNQGIERMYHLDLYRLKDKKEVVNVDLKEYLEDETGVVVIEWPEISQDLVKKKVWNVIFDTNENERAINIQERT